MDMIPLSAQMRLPVPSARVLRRQGVVPCILYGYKTDNTLLSCKEIPLQKAFTAAGQSTLVELDIGTHKVPALFYHVAYDPVTDNIAHVDFYAVNMKEEVEAEVPIRFTDTAPATKEVGVILVTPLTRVTVRSLPASLPHSLNISLSPLQKIHDVLYIRDIPLPAGVTITDDADTVIAIAQEQRIEEEPEPTVTAEAVEGATPAIAEGEEAAPTVATKDAPKGKKEKKEE
ncbi:50S ribosomal protein L25 [Candidatus Peregrinibacteria bacterium]|nr:50S ribosomal protein L25 [Candidatus Peregrinibacteria bacterium]